MSKLDSNFWVPTPIAPIPTLARLREMVLERSEQRAPKWKLRIAPDLVLQIQPKLTTALLRFEGRALQCEGASLEILLRPRWNAGKPYWQITFELRAEVADQWLFKPKGCSSNSHADLTGCADYFARHEKRQAKRRANLAAYVDLRACVVEVLSTRFDKLHPDMLLGSHCLRCGKGLTDPVSQARFIGPECAGTASADLPFILKESVLAA